MKFTVADTFQRSLGKLTNEEQTRAKAATFDFQVNPATPGSRYEKLHKAKDKNFRSIRVGLDLRFILHDLGESICACYVGHHDDAYRWSETHKQEVHPVTGAMQIVEVIERTEEVVRRVVKDEFVSPPLFRNFESDYILALGIPEIWLDSVMAVASDDDLLKLIGHLPQEASERLLELADGRPVPRPEPLKGSIDPYEHPDAQRRFKIIDSKDALSEALDYPWEKWIVFLHPTQRKLVERSFKGPARVSGAAGTGKTVVALHRAAHLARNNPNARVLLTTFSRTLAFRLAHQADLLLATETAVRDRIFVDHLHKLAREVWCNSTGGRFQALSNETLVSVLERAAQSQKTQFPIAFVRSEWEAVIEPANITSWERYKSASRSNRGTPLGARQRQALWTIFETAQKTFADRGLMSWGKLCFEAAQVKTIRQTFTNVVADEYQDLGAAELTFLRSLTPAGTNDLFLCGDSGQRIYKGAVSWLSLGIDVRGRASSLTVNYRTTEQIRRFADRIGRDHSDDSTGEAEDRKSVSLLSGPEPQVQGSVTVAEEIAGAAKWISSLVAEGHKPDEIAVFVHGQQGIRDRAEAVCRMAGLACRELSDESQISSEGVAVGTMHRAKGLEFKAVLIMGCDDKLLPMRAALDRLADQTEREAFIEQERRLLYVACTRARERLLLTYSGTKSTFLP